MAVRKRIGAAESREWTHWHLTPQGWLPGAWAQGSLQELTVPPPTDRVLTSEYCVYRTPDARLVALEREIWRAANFVTILDLLEKWGQAPRRLYVRRPPRPRTFPDQRGDSPSTTA